MRTTFKQEPPGPDGVLGELAAVREARREVERREAALVRRARNEGIVWEQMRCFAWRDEAGGASEVRRTAAGPESESHLKSRTIGFLH